MSTIKDIQPPGELVHFLLAVKELSAPADVQTVLDLLRQCVGLNDDLETSAREGLNRRVGQKRRQNPDLFRKVWRWAKTAEVKEACIRVGGKHAWRVCRRAFALIHKGTSAHVAFGMNKRGRRDSTRFSPVDDAAMLAKYYAGLGLSRAESREKAQQIVRQASRTAVEAKRKVLPTEIPKAWTLDILLRWGASDTDVLDFLLASGRRTEAEARAILRSLRARYAR